MSRRATSAGLDWTESEDSRARTEPVRETPLSAYVPWLERVALVFIRARSMKDVVACERLIAAIHDLEDGTHDETGQVTAPPPRFDATPLAGEVRQLMGGMRAVLRAVGTGDLPLDDELRTELAALVSDIVEVVMAVDLSKKR